ncbi:MAG: ABC transporter permease subunit [Treponema sp.]|jgi:putative aldouronate transport system permease protein|nr:ABC transporter permease subunit [Treponema sp.]
MTNKPKKKLWSKDDTEFTVLALPTAVWYFLFCYMPMFGIIIAFKDYRISGSFINSIVKSRWVGFENFKFLFSNPDIWIIIRNTLLYNVVMIACGIVIPVTLALIISELRNKTLAKIYQTILFFPYFLSWVVVSTVVWAFLSYDMGMINMIAIDLGLPQHNWYTDRGFWPGFLVFMSQWKGVGYGTVIYLAAITSLDKTVYEAAIIDGATKWQQIWNITLPMIKTVIVLMFILAAGRIFYSDFGLFFQVPRDSNSLYRVVYTIDVFVYKQLRLSTVGMASAAAFLQAVISCFTILMVNQIVRKVDADSAMI